MSRHIRWGRAERAERELGPDQLATHIYACLQRQTLSEQKAQVASDVGGKLLTNQMSVPAHFDVHPLVESTLCTRVKR